LVRCSRASTSVFTRVASEMDTQIGDVYTSMVDREIEIIHSLREKVMEYGEQIHDALMDCVELDWSARISHPKRLLADITHSLLCFANAAEMYNWCRPSMVEENVIHIKNGRHPLQELVVESFVPNDCHMAGGNSTVPAAPEHEVEEELKNIMILTGANGCGKVGESRNSCISNSLTCAECILEAGDSQHRVSFEELLTH
jgi:DNA mismatch repair protein MSH5